jgi:hypothetical protein
VAACEALVQQIHALREQGDSCTLRNI